MKDIPSNSVSLLVVRSRDGQIRTFHNVCPHRGTQLCWGKSGSVAAFNCPYHGFSFNLEGKLTFVPDEANFYDLDKSQMGLTPVVTDVWEGFIFIHLDPHPRQTLREYLGKEITESVAGFPFHERTRYHEYKAILDCNWKVLTAAFLEAFKGRTLHARSAGRVTSLDNPYAHNDEIKLSTRHRFIRLYSNPVAQPTRVGQIMYGHRQAHLDKTTDAVEDKTQRETRLFAKLNKSYVIHNVFPNFQLNLVRGNWIRYQLWPLSIGLVLWELGFTLRIPRTRASCCFRTTAVYRAATT